MSSTALPLSDQSKLFDPLDDGCQVWPGRWVSTRVFQIKHGHPEDRLVGNLDKEVKVWDKLWMNASS